MAMSNQKHNFTFSCADESLIQLAKERAQSAGTTFSKFVVGLLLKEAGKDWKDYKRPATGRPRLKPVASLALQDANSKIGAAEKMLWDGEKKVVYPPLPRAKKSAKPKTVAPAVQPKS